MNAMLFMWHAVLDGSLGNAPPGRLQIYGFFESAVPATLAKDFCPRGNMFKA
jgi:hypothetical protein